jgi:tRNA(adenine34) deaminase
MSTPLRYMRETLSLAESALELGELPIAALVVLDERVLASATTREKREGRFLVHAELLALEAADKLWPFPGNRRDVQLYTNLEPCLMCLGAAMSFFVGEVHYALESPTDGAVALVQGWKRDEVHFSEYRLPAIKGGMLRQESIRLFQRYVAMQPPGPLRDWARSLADLGQGAK